MRRVVLAVLFLLAGCQATPPTSETLRIYSTVTEATVNAVIDGFTAANPDVTIELFRAATGEVSARIAAEMRQGGLQADVLWLTDPLSMQAYQSDGLLRSWTPEQLQAVPEQYRTDFYFGTRLLNMVIVAGADVVSSPADWDDLTMIDGGVAIPDPAFAGSAFAALAYFSHTDGFGLDFYRRLAANDTTQLQSPADVVTGVAEGIYAAGMALDQGVRAAIADGSPVTLVWPSSGAIAIESPIAVIDATDSDQAESFIEFVLSIPGQEAIANTGWQPIREDVLWTATGGDAVAIDWSAAFADQSDLLSEYAAIFGS